VEDLDIAGEKSLTRKELEKITVVVNRDIMRLLACPPNSLNVVSTKGLPIRCSEEYKCPSSDMFCYRSRIESICCQEFRQKGETEHQSGAANQLSVQSDDAKKLINELKLQAGLPAIVGAPNEAQSSRAIFLADNEKSKDSQEKSSPDESEAKAGRIRVQMNRSKAQAVRTEVGPISKKEDEEQEIEYKPHNQGGYAVSRDKLNKINARKTSTATQKLIAQQFLISQIRSGWPYDERFYRGTEGTTSGHNGLGQRQVVVHFPSE